MGFSDKSRITTLFHCPDIFTVPTTCSRPSTTMSAFMFFFVFTVPTTCSRPSTKMSAFSFCIIFTVPTTCSRPSTNLSAFSCFFLLCRLLVVGLVLK